MRATGFGRILFGLSIAVLGALGIAFHDFAFAWQLVPKDIAGHDALAIMSGVFVIASGIALLVPRTARLSALALAIYLFVFVLVARVPHVVAQPLLEANWYGLGETLVLVAGAWTIFATRPVHCGQAFAKLDSVRLGQILFALALPALGLAHFFYVDQTAPLIPAWLPFHVPLAYFTGGAHIAAGLAILLGILAWLAATLEAVMVSVFTLLVWVPAVIAAPRITYNRVELTLSAAIAGAAWAVAESFRPRNYVQHN